MSDRRFVRFSAAGTWIDWMRLPEADVLSIDHPGSRKKDSDFVIDSMKQAPLRKAFLALFGIAAILCCGLTAHAGSMKDVGEAAALMIAAQNAVVSENGGRTTVTLRQLAPVVTAVAALGENRRFETFSLAEFPTSWNSCNAMKEENKWSNRDGFNAILQFENGPGKLAQNAHFEHSRLVTTKIRNDETTMATSGGSARLMLSNANGGAEALTFDVTGGKLVPGSYSGVGLLTECILGDP